MLQIKLQPETIIKVDTSGNDEIHDLVKDIDMMARMLSENTQKLVVNEQLSTIEELSVRTAHDLRNSLNVIKNRLESIMIKNSTWMKNQLNFLLN